MTIKQRNIYLVGWHGNGALGDDLLEHCVRLVIKEAAVKLGVKVVWSSSFDEADYILIGGGTLLGFDTMGIYDLVSSECKPYSIFGTGFRREQRKLGSKRSSNLNELLLGADHAFVRGFLSQQFCVHAGVAVPDVISDPAIWFTPQEVQLDPCYFHIGISLRSMGRGGGGEPQYVDNQQMFEIINQCINILAHREDIMLHLFDLSENQYDSDRKALADIFKKWGGRVPVITYDIGEGFHNIFSHIAAMDWIISQRLHPSIVGWSTGKPHVAFDYQNSKTADFCSTFGVSEFCIRSDTYTIDTYRSTLSLLESDYKIVRKQALQSAVYWQKVQLAAATNILQSCFSKE